MPAAFRVKRETLPGLGQDDAVLPSKQILQDIEGARISAARAGAIFKRRMLIQQVQDRQIDPDMLQEIIGGQVAGVITQRQIERVPRRFNIAVVADGAGEGGPGSTY